MDEGWETARNSRRPDVFEEEVVDGVRMCKLPPDAADWAILRLGTQGDISELEVDTNHFKGNSPESCVVECATITGPIVMADELAVCTAPSTIWRPLLPRTLLTSHTRHYFTLAKGQLVAAVATHVRITIFPDGGISRLRVLGRAQADAKL
jgi:allantoicase